MSKNILGNNALAGYNELFSNTIEPTNTVNAELKM